MHLILTVGTNPLPVYVAGINLLAYFKQEETPIAHVTLVMSTESKIYQNVITNKLSSAEEKINIDSIIVDSGDPNNIRENIKDCITTTIGCHFHYTGGTKALAVHCWQEIMQQFTWEESDNSYSASYLNPRGGNSGPYIIDDEGRTLVADCRITSHMKINELLKIHNYVNIKEVKEPPSGWPMLLFNIVRQKESMKKYDTYMDNKKAGWLKMRSSKEQSCMPPEGIPENQWLPFCTELNNFLDEKYSPAKFDDTGVFKRHGLGKEKLKLLTKELNGKFLEYALYDIIEEKMSTIAEKNQSRQNYCIYNSIEPIMADTVEEGLKKREKKETDNMELDVVLILGYQLILFSCTALDDQAKGAVKLKAMEAMHRAQQIGGDEARAVVVSAFKEETAKQTRTELYEDCGRGTESLIEIWGFNTWEKLEKTVENYITQTLKWQ